MKPRDARLLGFALRWNVFHLLLGGPLTRNLPTIVSLDHVQLAMPREGESLARMFYGDLLGLLEIPKPLPLVSRGGVWFELPDGRQLHLGVQEPFNPAGKAHPCFVVRDIEKLMHRLIELEFPVLRDALAAPIVRFYAPDCFGNRLEFADRPSAEAG